MKPESTIQSGIDLELSVFDKPKEKSKSLYHIEKEYATLMTDIESLEGEITPDIESRLVIVEKERSQKSIAYLSVIKTKELFITQIDDEIKRLTALKKRNQNLVEMLKSRLLDAVKLFGVYEVGFNKFGTRKSSSVEVADVNSLPKEYKVIKVTEQADKDKIKEALKNGIKITGCEIVEKENLKIN